MKKLNLNLNAKVLSKDQMKSVKGGTGQTLTCSDLLDFCYISEIDCDYWNWTEACAIFCGKYFFAVSCA